MRRWLPCQHNGAALLRNRFLNEPNIGTFYITGSADLGIPYGWGDFCKKLEIVAMTVILVKLEMVCGRLFRTNKC
jgi:hypothetical protein